MFSAIGLGTGKKTTETIIKDNIKTGTKNSGMN